MKVLLTGATGFIGSHVARLLVKQGHEVHAVTRAQSDLWRIADIKSSLHLIEGDLLDPSFAFRAPSFDLCIHLAWYVEPGKYISAPENRDYIEASVRLVKMLRSQGCRRFVAAGTCFEYDLTIPAERLAETHPTKPVTLYGQCKLELFHSLERLDIEFVWVRFFYQYGPREDARRLVPHVINALLRGEEASLTPGDQVRDFLHVEDVASAVCAVAGSHLTGPVNIGSGRPVSVRDIAETITAILKKPELIALGARPYPPNEPMRIVADNAKLRTGTDWKPRFDLETGLRNTVDWWKARQ